MGSNLRKLFGCSLGAVLLSLCPASPAWAGGEVFSHIDIPELNRGGGPNKFGVRPNSPHAEVFGEDELWEVPTGVYLPTPSTESGAANDEFLDVRGIETRGLSGSAGVSTVPTPGAVSLFGMSLFALGAQRRRR